MLKGYEEYKDTGYDWIPLVPKTWKQRTIRSITSLSNERNGKRKDLELLSVYREFGVIKKSSRDDNHNVESQDLSNYKYVNSCYLVMNKMKMWQGSLGISQHEGIVSPAYIVCKVDQNIIGKYLHYLLRSSQFKTFYNRISYGVRVGQWDLRYNDLKNLKIYLPTSDEQNQIVRYLDAKDSKINRLISAKKKEIVLLKEYKQAIISRVVTKGLDENVEMKDCGVKAIGCIPHNWNVIKIKHLFQEINRKNTDLSSPLLTFSRTNGLIPFGQGTNKLPSASDLSKYKVVKPGDFLMNRMQAWSGMFKYVTIDGCVSPDYSVFEPISNINLKYYELLFRSPLHIEQFSNASKGVGSGFNRLYTPEFGAIYTLFPPINEQNQIACYLDEKAAKINRLISAKIKEIEMLTEYKTRLISDVVTGKVDVRGIHVEDIPEAELIDEFDEEIVDEFDDETSEEENIE